MKKENEELCKFYFEVYKHIVKNKGVLTELYNHGLDCSIFNNLLTEPVIPKKKLKTMMQKMGMDETLILEVHLKKYESERYTDIYEEMKFALQGYKSLLISNLLNDAEKKQIKKIWERIYKTYSDNLWEWYVKHSNACSRADKDIKTVKQSVAWLCKALFNYIMPFKRRADQAGLRPNQKDIPNQVIYGMIADIINHGKKRSEKLTSKKVKWYIENYEKIKA